MLLERLPGIRQARWSLRNPPDEILDLLTGGKTAAGERISARSALQLAPYFAGIRAISEDVGKLPLPVYKRLTPRGRERQYNHPIDYMLNIEANPEMSAQTLRETLLQHALGWGNGYAEIIFEGTTARFLYLLDPELVEPKRDLKTKALYYEVRTQENSASRRVEPGSVFHIHGMGFDGLGGYSIARYARETLGEVAAEAKAGGAFFGNNSRPGGVLESSVPIKDITKLREDYEKGYKGASKFNLTAVLPFGLTYKPISIPNRDAQWVESREFSVEEVARWFRIPPHKIQHNKRATFSNIAEQNIEYVTDCLDAWLKRFEQEVSRKLLGGTRRALYAEHNIAALMRGDPKARNESYALGKQWGWWSTNDIREKENENPIGEAGDVYLVPTTHANADTLLEPPEPEPMPAEEPESPAEKLAALERQRELLAGEETITSGLVWRIVNAHAPLFRDTFGRLLKYHVDWLKRKTGPFDYEKYRDVAVQQLETRIGACIASIGSLIPGGLDESGHGPALTIAIHHVASIETELATADDKDALYLRWLNGQAAEDAATACREIHGHIVGLLEGRGIVICED